MKEDKYKYLGWQNGWIWSSRDALPFEYVRCCDAGHTRREENIGKCQTQTYCDTCCIAWKYDSGD